MKALTWTATILSLGVVGVVCASVVRDLDDSPRVWHRLDDVDRSL
ncbi:MAG: hypothetical protein Q4B10_06005 [Actinomycetaceae bacterium]|nr:hypothetical protein [Actinomycetaceae bacterium]